MLANSGSIRTRLIAVLAVIAAIMATVALLPATPGDTIADRELGQVDLSHSTSPSFVRKKSLSLRGDPRGSAVVIDRFHNPNRIYIADNNSNRVLGWSDVSTFTNGQDADIVIGPPPNNLTSPPGAGDFSRMADASTFLTAFATHSDWGSIQLTVIFGSPTTGN